MSEQRVGSALREEERVEAYLQRALARQLELAFKTGQYPTSTGGTSKLFHAYTQRQIQATQRLAGVGEQSGTAVGQGESQGSNRADADGEADQPKWIDELPGPGQDQVSQWKAGPGIAKARRGPGWSPSDPKPLGTVVSGLAQRSGWNRILSVASISVQWEQIVGPEVAKNCRIERFTDEILYVQARSTAWATQLRLMLPTIEGNIARQLGSGVVKKVIISGPAAPSWRKGPLHVPGRGPRDTYG
ncbi:MAG: DciA family protein [Actinomycetaceae bacterium]|nr:DciA family protein [Actinomycetaceae bacterium]